MDYSARTTDIRYWCVKRGCQGVRINPIAEPDASWLLGGTQEGTWTAATELAVPVLLQIVAAQAPVVDELARRWPQLTFIVDYLGPDAFHDGSGMRALTLLSRRPNVWYKLLSVAYDSHEAYPYRDLWPLYQHAVASLGADRLLLGSDFPNVRRACSYEDAIRWFSELPFLDDAIRATIGESNVHTIWTFQQR